MEQHSPLRGHDDEYAPLALGGEAWGAISVLLFLLSISSRFLVALLPEPWSRYPTGAFLSALGVPAFSGLGLLLGLAGLRFSRGKAAARMGVFLNAVALILSLLLIAVFVYLVVPRSRLPVGTGGIGG